MKNDYIFKNATVITMNDDKPILKNTYVGVSNGKISFISQQLPDDVDALNFIDCSDKILMPGLINTHTHLAMMLLRGVADDYPLQEWLFEKVFPLEAKLDPKCVYIGTKLAIAEGIRTGTTSYTDNYFFAEEIAKAAIEAGVKINIANMATHFGDNEYDPSRDRAITEMHDLLNTYHMHDDGRIITMAGIHAPYTSPKEVWEHVANVAREKKLGISLHLAESRTEVTDLQEKFGKTGAMLFDEAQVFDSIVTAAHCVHLTEDDMKLLASKNAVVSHCPVSNLKLANGIADVPAMLKHGLLVSLGTDGSCANNNMDLFEELKLTAILHKGTSGNAQAVPAYEALKMATVNGAYAQGRADRAGKIEVGFDADIILLDLNPINMFPTFDPVSAVVYSASGKDVVFTMVQGKVLYQDGNFSTVDIEKLKSMLIDYALPKLGLNL